MTHPNKEQHVMRRAMRYARYAGPLLVLVAVGAYTAPSIGLAARGTRTDKARQDQIAHGRFLITSHACGDCHGGGNDPAAFGWLDGARSPVLDVQYFKIGPFTTRAKNLTP